MPPALPFRLAAPLALALMTLLALAALALASGVALAGCASSGPGASEVHVEPEWRLVPEGTALGQRRQFFLYGRHLDSVRVSAPPSVSVEKGNPQPGGHALPLYLIVNALSKDSLAKGESVGGREIRVQTPDTSLTFKLKIVDESLPR
jgi:hypothetical protein